MESAYPLVPLGDIASRSEEWTSILPDVRYREITVRMWGKGVVLRGELNGAEIASSKRLIAREDQLILSRIDARNGAIGIVPHQLDGAVVTNDFPTFELRKDRVLPEYLNWLSKTSDFVDLCRAASEGTTNRVRLQEVRFLRLHVPVPPLAEQQRVVARIEALAGKIDEVQRLKADISSDCDWLCRSLIANPNNDISHVPVSSLVRWKQCDAEVDQTASYQFAGVYCFGRGVFCGQVKKGLEIAYPRLTRLNTNDFVYPKLMAWEGAFGVVPPECNGLVVSPEFPVFEIDQSKVLPETLDVFFRTPAVWPLVASISTGTNVRRRRLNPETFLSFVFPLPSMKVQRQLQSIKRRTDRVKAEQVESTKELDALLPAVLDRAFRGKL